MKNIEKVLKDGYIEANEMSGISNSNKQYIIDKWVYVKNKHTYKEYYIIPCTNNDPQSKIRFELLKAACEHQPETLEEKIKRELNT
tara:strand:- start:650 stop:907 length:258 start_codon:yes stop_codon:yes gene_type:complete